MSRRTANSKHYIRYKIKGINRCSFLLYWFWHKSHYENVPFEIPESWAWVTLSEVCEVARGGSPRPIKDYLTTNEDGVNWIKIGDTDKDGKYINSTKEKIIPEGVHRSRFVHKGDFLLTNSMSFGRPYILNIDGCIHDGWLVISPFANTYVTEFLYFLLSSSFAYEQFADAASGGVVSNLNSDKVANSYFPLPPEREQRRIINELNNWFKVVGELDKNIQGVKSFVSRIKSKILDLAISGKLVPQDPDDEPAIELLKRINPDFQPCDNSHYENLPQGWTVCKIKDIFNITMGQSPTGESINGVKGIEFHQGKIHFTESYLSQSGVYTDQPTKIAEVDSLLLCVRAPVGVLNITQRKICIGRGLCALKPKYEIDNLYWLFILTAYKDYFESNATGSTFKAISGDTIKNAVIKLPPLQEQKRILSSIISLYESLDAITAEL